MRIVLENSNILKNIQIRQYKRANEGTSKY